MKLYIEEQGSIGNANVTAATNDIQYPVSNVVNPLLTRLYRTDAATTAEITFDLLSAKEVSGVVIGAHNVTSGATEIKVQMNSSNSWGSPAFEIDAVWSAGFIYVEFPVQTYRYLRVRIVDGANPDLYIQIGRIWVGKVYATPGISYSIINDYETTSVKTKSRGGQTWGDKGYLFDRFQVRYPMITIEQRDELRRLFSIADIITPFLYGLIKRVRFTEYNM